MPLSLFHNFDLTRCNMSRQFGIFTSTTISVGLLVCFSLTILGAVVTVGVVGWEIITGDPLGIHVCFGVGFGIDGAIDGLIGNFAVGGAEDFDSDGKVDAILEGCDDGDGVGTCDGFIVGTIDCNSEGIPLGASLGEGEGCSLCAKLGCNDV